MTFFSVVVRYLVAITCSSFAITGPAGAAKLSSYQAALYRYFSQHKLLPMDPPNGEVPGDWLSHPIGGALAVRAGVCFGALTPTRRDTALPGHFVVYQGSVGGILETDLRKAVEVGAELGFRLSRDSAFFFPDAVVSRFSEDEMLKALANSETECRDAINRVQSRRESSYVEKVPWILQEVYFAKPNVSIEYQWKANVQAHAEPASIINKLLEKSRAVVDAESTKRSLVHMQSNMEYAVAYRPAFISLDDLERLQRLDERGILSMLRQALDLEEQPDVQLKSIQREFPEVLTSPRKQYEHMVTGKTVPFETTNASHMRYLEQVGLLLAASWQLYPGSADLMVAM